MDFRRVVALLLAISATITVLGSQGYAQTVGPHPKQQAEVLKLLKSLENNQYASFIEDGSDYFRSRISEQHFNNVSQRVAQQLKNGYDLIYLTEFKQAGLVGTLWKIEFKDGSDDALAKIFLEDGKIAGFWFQ
jgi:hypothetical protein